jgi:glucokinase
MSPQSSTPPGHALGIDLGGTRIKAIVVDPSGQVHTRKTVSFGRKALQWAEQVREVVEEIQRQSEHKIAAIGLCAPGLANPNGASISHMPGRLEGLENFDWRQHLERTEPVPVLNDAHAALLGEAWIGAAQDISNVILLTLGTGVGGAILINGELLSGPLGRGGHLGHITLDSDGPPDVTGMPGSLEDAIGDCTIGRRSHGKFRSTYDVVEAHRKGDPEASAIWLRSLKQLAAGVASLINILDPEAVIIGGGIAEAGSALFDPLEKFLGYYEWRPGGHRVRILPARLGEYAGAMGAARRAMTHAAQS